MQLFANALGSRALPGLTYLNLQGGQVADAGMQALSAALGSGALPLLKELWLSENQIGDSGVAAFAAACGNGAIPKLQTDARAAWRDVLTDRDGTFESWYKCTIEVHPQKRSNGPWMISAPADLRAAMPRKVAARLSEGERYDFEYEPPSDWCEIDELEGWEKWHLIWNKNFREWWQAAE